MERLRLLRIKEKLKGLNLTKEKIFKFTLVYICPLSAFFLVSFIFSFIPFGGYLSVTSMYFVLCYYLLLYIIKVGNINKSKDKDSLYVWLDKLGGGHSLLNDLFIQKNNRDVITNLEEVYYTFNHFTKYDKRKLKLLKAYYKTLNEEGPLDIFFKSIHGVILAIVIWGVNKGYLLSLAQYTGDTSTLGVAQSYITVLNFISFIIIGITYFALLIIDYFSGKKRIKIVLEILDVCIDDKD